MMKYKEKEEEEGDKVDDNDGDKLEPITVFPEQA